MTTHHHKKLIIALDGPAGSGKSTTARLVAKDLGYTYIDTGAMYRAITLEALRNGISVDDEFALTLLVQSTQIELRMNNGVQHTFVNGEDVSERIRQYDVTSNVSAVSAVKSVRTAMVAMQQAIGAKGGVVMDGRDIGTVVFPNADVKIFMVASISARAKRRLAELQNSDGGFSELDIANQLSERDKFDSEREESPLKKADDAIEIDTSDMTIEQQVQSIVAIVQTALINATAHSN